MRMFSFGSMAMAGLVALVAGGAVMADECPVAKQQRLAKEAAAGHVQTVAYKAEAKTSSTRRLAQAIFPRSLRP